MSADGFDYKIAAGLHRDRLAEAEQNRRARAVRAKAAERRSRESAITLKRRIGRQLIIIGERMSA